MEPTLDETKIYTYRLNQALNMLTYFQAIAAQKNTTNAKRVLQGTAPCNLPPYEQLIEKLNGSKYARSLKKQLKTARHNVEAIAQS